jgi:predicted nucleotidyltransferase
MTGKNTILETIKEHKPELLNRFGVENIAVFGSLARGEQESSSDVDIFVTLRKEYKTFDNFMELKFYLEDTLKCKIDLMLKETIREQFKNKIYNEAIYA